MKVTIREKMKKKMMINQTRNVMIKCLFLTAMLFLGAPVYNVYAQPEPKQKQCQATTKKGTRCKREAEPNSKFCDVHQAKDPKVKQCKAMTKSGSRCSRAAKADGYCTQHLKMHKEGKI